MIFASQTFLFGFLPLFFILYLAAGKFFGLRGKNTVLFFMSLIFYAWGEPVYIVLMIYSSVLDYVCGRMIYSADRQEKTGKKKAFLCVSMVGNLALLGVFKYLGFFTQTVNSVFHLSIPVFSLALPVGISFYTFQTMSYSLDVYRGTITPQKNFIYFGAYVAMFPQLIAGPVVRYSDIARELDCRTENLNGFASGARKLICGLAKKVLIANTMAAVADPLFENPASSLGVLGTWIAIIAYTFQIFFDFSGYSDMAIGMGRMMGFNYPENFNYPYISRSVTEFWRRWHITMSTFFRDYVYIPLGGSRCSVIKWLRNVFIVWFLTGLWHGAAWHYVAWGLYFGVLLVVEKFLLRKLLEKSRVISHVYAMLMIVCGWVIFRCDSVSDALSFIGSMFGASGLYGSDTVPSPVLLQQSGVSTVFFVTLIFAVLFSAPIIPWLKNKLESSCTKLALRGAVYCTADFVLIVLLVLSSVQLALGSYNPFIYFDF